MATPLDPLRGGLGRAWDSLAEGWQHLRHRAGEALTRFRPARRGELERAEEQPAAQGARWGLLTADVREDEEAVEVRLEVPGMDADAFDIDVVGDTLVVTGEKHLENEQTRGRFHVMECAYGRFERVIPLPAEVDDGEARAGYRKGVLHVRLPKTHGGRRRRIEVRSG